MTRPIANRFSALTLLANSQPIDPGERLDLLLRLHISLADMHAGKEIPIDWHEVAKVVNMTRILCEGAKTNAAAALPFVEAAHQAMLTAADRSADACCLHVIPDELAALQDVARIYEDLLGVVSLRQYNRACEAIQKRIQSGDRVTMRKPTHLQHLQHAA